MKNFNEDVPLYMHPEYEKFVENDGILKSGPRTRAPWTKAPRRQKIKVFNTLFLGKNKLKQRNYIRTKLRLEELNKRVKLIQKR